jgi:immune inhibitor A
VSHRKLTVVGGATLLALLAAPGLVLPASAAPPADPDTTRTNAAATKLDDRPDPLAEKRREIKKTALQQVIKGEADVQSRGGGKSVKVAPGQWAQYDLQNSDEVLSFLVEFGDEQADTRPQSPEPYPTAPAGPVHNQIPEPDRSTDNSTYWVEDFNRQHFMDMFFNGMPEQGGESFKDVYEEMSSGRYTINGDVGDWVEVPFHEARYGEGESHADMTYFIDDTAESWYDSQVAAGKSDAEIEEYLSTFDQWDRYDGDQDGVFEEPDGYIDHFQAIHAGEGEEAGAPSGAIWSHRWAVNQNGFHADGIGPSEYTKFGGIEIGDTDLWIRDYTTEPENGGLGVFAHEYAHDLGLPDLYDRQGGENGTGFWTLMSSGSWLGHGEDAIGTTPNHMGAWEKMMLGWLDYEVAQADTPSEHKLGPSYHGSKRSQAVVVNLPQAEATVELEGEAAEGEDYFYSGRGDDRTSTLTSPAFTVPDGGQLAAKANYAIEVDWDYAFVEVSTDGGDSFTPVETNLSTSTDPNGQNDGHGITGDSGGAWVDLTADLSSYAGQEVQLRFRMFNDAAVNEMGFKVDAISVGTALSEGAEDGAPGWTMDEFVVVENGSYSAKYDHYYIAENRVYGGYDRTLETGPYNFGFPEEPNRVEHFPYQNGLLVTYWNTWMGNNDTSDHPGAGEILPVDARGEALRWSDGSVARNRIQSFDATFGTEATDPISLHNGDATLEVPGRSAERVFDDTQGQRYYDPENPQGSVIVPNTGTQIRVENANAKQGMMLVQVD